MSPQSDDCWSTAGGSPGLALKQQGGRRDDVPEKDSRNSCDDEADLAKAIALVTEVNAKVNARRAKAHCEPLSSSSSSSA